MANSEPYQVVPNFSDPRLTGWVPETQYRVPVDERYEIREIARRESGGLFGHKERLLVYFDVVDIDGQILKASTPFYYERPAKVDLRELSGLLAYAKSIPLRDGDREAGARFVDGEKGFVDGGPPLDYWIVRNAALTAENLDRLKNDMSGVAAGTVQPHLALMLAQIIADGAYRLGRQTREDELRVIFEADAELGRKYRAATADGAAKTNKGVRTIITARRLIVRSLGQGLLNHDRLPDGYTSWNAEALAAEIRDKWPDTSIRPRIGQLETDVKVIFADELATVRAR